MNNPAPRVLVVDRDAHVRNLLDIILPEAGFQPIFMADGYAALDHARRDPPEIVLTEIMVPRLDGLALCRLLKGDATTSGTKVLVLSVLAAEARALTSGADAFIKKPIERTALVEALRGLSPPASRVGDT
jgi:DNA-binding response OmpR family regulator